MSIYHDILRWIDLPPVRVERIEMGQVAFDALKGSATLVEDLVRAVRGDYLTGVPIHVRGEGRDWRALAADGSIVAQGAL